MSGKMSAGMRRIEHDAEHDDQKRHYDERVRSPKRELDDPHDTARLGREANSLPRRLP